ncbi:Uncharacterised protein at_DN2064 [Pycnogonum litorale]
MRMMKYIVLVLIIYIPCQASITTFPLILKSQVGEPKDSTILTVCTELIKYNMMRKCMKTKRKNICITECVARIENDGTLMLRQRVKTIQKKITDKNIDCTATKNRQKPCTREKIFSAYIKEIDKILSSRNNNSRTI